MHNLVVSFVRQLLTILSLRSYQSVQLLDDRVVESRNDMHMHYYGTIYSIYSFALIHEWMLQLSKKYLCCAITPVTQNVRFLLW